MTHIRSRDPTHALHFIGTTPVQTTVCSFACHGTGAASRVTKLDIYLGRIPDEPDSHALYYSIATEYAQYATGFALGGKLTPLPCQMIGMRLDYSGRLKGNAPLASQK